MEQDKIQDFCEDYYWKQGLYYLGQSSALLGQFRLSSICQLWFRPSLIFPSAFLLLNSGNLVALVMAAVPVADAPEDISQSGLAFLGTLEPSAHCQECYSGHLCHGGYSITLRPINASSGHNPNPACPILCPPCKDPGLNLSRYLQNPIMCHSCWGTSPRRQVQGCPYPSSALHYPWEKHSS